MPIIPSCCAPQTCWWLGAIIFTPSGVSNLCCQNLQGLDSIADLTNINDVSFPWFGQFTQRTRYYDLANITKYTSTNQSCSTSPTVFLCHLNINAIASISSSTGVVTFVSAGG